MKWALVEILCTNLGFVANLNVPFISFSPSLKRKLYLEPFHCPTFIFKHLFTYTHDVSGQHFITTFPALINRICMKRCYKIFLQSLTWTQTVLSKRDDFVLVLFLLFFYTIYKVKGKNGRSFMLTRTIMRVRKWNRNDITLSKSHYWNGGNLKI